MAVKTSCHRHGTKLRQSPHVYRVPKTSTFYFLNNCVKNQPILMTCWRVKSWENLTPHLSHVATVPWDIQKSHLTRKQSVIHLPTPPENVTTLTCELQIFFIWLKVCCVLSNVGGSEKSQLWCMATGMSGKQCHSRCSEWPRSALVHASSLFRQCSVA